MIPWVQLGVATVPDGGGELRLMQRGTEFSIFAGATELMGSRQSGSEVALANLACGRVSARPGARVLIGGLGMGFTLRAALAALPADAEVTIAELVPEVVAWARGPLAAIHGASLEDPRLTVFDGDVGRLIEGAKDRWDAILLDVDNGPEGLTRAANDDLYDTYGLGQARAALRPGGVLAVWSTAADAGFTRRLKAAGFKTEEHSARSNGRRGARHVIWLATK